MVSCSKDRDAGEAIQDPRPTRGQVWMRIVWQSGAVRERKIRRTVNSYRNYADIGMLEARVGDLTAAQKIDPRHRRNAYGGRLVIRARPPVQPRRGALIAQALEDPDREDQRNKSQSSTMA